MRPAKTMLAAALATAGVGAGGATALAHVTAPARTGSTGTPTLKLMSTSKGKLLSSKGFVLYMFTHDKGTKNTCVKIAGCKAAWPALTTKGVPVTGTGVKKSLLSTTKLPNGKKQVTYAGHPIYKYAFGTKHSTSYVGINAFGGFWYGLKGSGKVVK